MNIPMIGLTPEHLISLFEQSPVPITIFDHTGLQVATNTASMTLFGVQPEDTVGRFNMLTDPQLAATGSIENHRRVMQGETIVLPPHSYNAREYQNLGDAGEERWVEAVYSPLRDASGTVTHLVAMLRDVTNEVTQKQAIVAARAEIASQRMLIESLSTPVVQVWEGILAMPLVGTIDSGRAMQITESLLMEIVEQQAECVIIDITGIPLVDTQVAQYLIQTAQASKLLGCEVALVGIGVEMAQTLVQLGVDLRNLTTLANLQAGIAWALERCGLEVVSRS